MQVNLTIDADSSIAPFEQVRLGVIALIASGELVAGSRLPTVRSLASELGLATNTVARAFRELKSKARQANKALPALDEGLDSFGARYTEIVRNGCLRLLEE